MIQCVLLGSVVVGGVFGENGSEREKGGWAVQCPTQGGTDEVKQKWRERGRGEWRRRSDKEQEQESKKKNPEQNRVTGGTLD